MSLLVIRIARIKVCYRLKRTISSVVSLTIQLGNTGTSTQNVDSPKNAKKYLINQYLMTIAHDEAEVINE